MEEMNLSSLKSDFIKSQNEQSGEVLRKKFTWRKATDKVFLRTCKGGRNKLLLQAINKAFNEYRKENLFFASEL